jgi:membrane-bound lytic murein transglycosylase B
VAHHRLKSGARDWGMVSKPIAVMDFSELDRLHSNQVRQRIARVALTVGAITPLVLACAAGGAIRQIPAQATAPTNAQVVAPATVVDSPRLPFGPEVVVAPSQAGRHVAATTPAAVPPVLATKKPNSLGIPSMAMAAYRHAEQLMASSDPGCGLSWNLLAGIGRIESGHANGGATDAHGTATRPIYGPALDGTLPGNETIVERSSNGRMSYAHAVGPMQFLPGTWARYAADGDGDGLADPQNLYDAALAAARYLCSGGLNLRDRSQVMSAILRYNNSIPYAQNVLGWAGAYATGVVPVDLPPLTEAAPPPLGDMHLDNPEGLGPGLPLNVHGLPPRDPLVQNPLIEIGQAPGPAQPPRWPAQPPSSTASGCTVICIGH